MSVIEKAIIKVVKHDTSQQKFTQALNDVARGFGVCGIFDLENWSEIVNSSFNTAFNSKEKSNNTQPSLNKKPHAEKEILSVTQGSRRQTMKNPNASHRLAKRRNTMAVGKVQPKNAKGVAVQTKWSTEERVTSHNGLSTKGTRKLTPRTLRSGSQQFYPF